MPLGVPVFSQGSGGGAPPKPPRSGNGGYGPHGTPPASQPPLSNGGMGPLGGGATGRAPSTTPAPPPAWGSRPGWGAPQPYDSGDRANNWNGIPVPGATTSPLYTDRYQFEANAPGGSAYTEHQAALNASALAAQLQQQYGNQQSALDANYATQAGLLGGQYDVNQRNMSDQAGYDQARLDQQRYRDVDSQGQYNNTIADLQRQLSGVNAADINARQGFADRGYDTTKNYISQRQGFADQGIGEERGYIGSLRGFNDTGQRIGLDQNQLAYDRNSRVTSSDAAARGAIGSHGYEGNMGELSRQLGLSNDSTRLSHDQTSRGLDNRSSTSELGYQQNTAGLQNESANNDLTHDTTTQGLATAAAQNKLSQQQQEAVNTRNQQMIDSLAKEYGIRGDQAAAALKAGTNKLGLDYNQAIIAMSGQHQKDTSSLQLAQAQMMTSKIMQAAQGAGGNAAVSTMSHVSAAPATHTNSNVRYS